MSSAEKPELKQELIEPQEKAIEMAYSEKSFRELAETAYKLGFKEMGDNYFKKGEQEAEESGKKWDEEVEKKLKEEQEWNETCKKKVEEIAKQVLVSLETNIKTGEPQEVNLDDIIGPDILFAERGAKQDEKDKTVKKVNTFFNMMNDFWGMNIVGDVGGERQLNCERKKDVPTTLMTYLTKIDRVIIEKQWCGHGKSWKDKTWVKERVSRESDIDDFSIPGWSVVLKILNLDEWQKIKDKKDKLEQKNKK